MYCWLIIQILVLLASPLNKIHCILCFECVSASAQIHKIIISSFTCCAVQLVNPRQCDVNKCLLIEVLSLICILIKCEVFRLEVDFSENLLSNVGCFDFISWLFSYERTFANLKIIQYITDTESA